MNASALDLLSAILENPQDDQLRLRFAECIEWNEPERCEFIRVQIAISLLREPEYKTARDLVPSIRNYPHGSCGACDVDRYCSYHALQARERELLDGVPYKFLNAYKWEWFGKIINCNQIKTKLSRGFISDVRILSRVALPYLPTILATQPIERITVEGVEVAIIKDRYGWQTWNTVWYNRATLVAGIGEWIESVLSRHHGNINDADLSNLVSTRRWFR